MSLKLPESFHRAAPPPAAPPPATRSIARRLTWLYGWTTLAIFALAAGLLYWDLKSNLEEHAQALLAAKVNILRIILRERPNDLEALREEVEWESAARRDSKYYTRLTDGAGQLLMITPGMEALIPEDAPFPPPADPSAPPVAGIPWRSPQGHTFLLTAAWARVGSKGDARYLQRIALDITRDQRLLAAYRTRLELVWLVGTVLAGGLGAWITRRSLQPLQAITRAAQQITVQRLDRRIAPAGWPRELTALALEFDRMLDRLETAFRRLSQFSADLAHELRTPINNLRGEAEVALSRPRPADEYRRVIESSLEELQALSDMIDSLLFLARAEKAEGELQRTRLQARAALDRVLEFYRPAAEERGVKLSAQGEADLWADRLLVERALTNLVDNALRYTPTGGSITLSAVRRPDGGAEIHVTDTGSGIPAQDLPHVFDRFYRVDSARTRGSAGSGLGLAIVKSIMDLHGGTATITSQPGHGTTVSLRFPPRP